MSECSSCQAKIIWARSLSGKKIPIDGTPLRELPERELGIFVLLRRSGSPDPLAMPLVGVGPLSLQAARDHQVPLFVSHFATCPHADEHRRG